MNDSHALPRVFIMKILSNLSLLFCIFALTTTTVVADNNAHIDVPQYLDGTTRVTAEELILLVESTPDLIIIDARKGSDYRKGYIEGAVSLPNTETSAKTLAKYIKNKQTPVLFYCNGVKCGRSVVAARVAVKEGYKHIYWFRGGMEEWESKGLPLVHP
jgi:rhodanese-related sulfurtransferase